MRKSILMMSSALVTIFLASAASALPSDKIGGQAGAPAAQSGKIVQPKSSVIDKSKATECVACKVTPTKTTPTVPGPKDKIGNKAAECLACKPGTPATPTPGAPPPKTTPTPTPMPPMGGGMSGGYGHGPHYGHYVPAFGLGFAAASAVEYVPVYQTAPVYGDAQAGYAPAPAVATQAVDNPFDAVLARLNQLNDALRQGLITQSDYRTQRPAILASLDAGQVSRSIGIQQGLRQLKSMSDAGAISGKEYDDKRREFAQFI